MNNKQQNPIYVTYDINFRNKCTENNIRYILTGLNSRTKKSFWVYNRLDEDFIRVLTKWINK